MFKNTLMLIVLSATLLCAGAVHASNAGGLPQCRNDLSTCSDQLSICTNELSAAQAFPATGQTSREAAGDDGDLKAGAALNYTDNGDGTLTDNNTKLMWEEKDNDSSDTLHYVNNAYPWAGKCSGNVTTWCGTDADCTVAGGTCNVSGGGMTIFQWVAQLNLDQFAGHSDWRIPNIKELQSIADYGSQGPTIDSKFGPTQSNFYWSGTSLPGFDGFAFGVDFSFALVYYDTKTVKQTVYVRAVRSAN